MHDEFDQVGRALASLRSEQRTSEHHKLELEEKLMQGFKNQTNSSRFAKYRTLIVSLAVVLIGGGVFAATGGVEKVRRLFVKVSIVGVDGSQQMEVVLDGLDNEPIELKLGESGEGTIIFEPDDEGDGESAIQMQFTLDGDASEGQVRIGTTIESATMNIDLQSADDDEAETSQVSIVKLELAESGFDLDQVMLQSLNRKGLAERIEAAEVLETWSTDDGRTRELYVLPVLNVEGAESGLQVVIVTEDDNGDRTAQLAGSIAGVDPATTKLTDLSWNDGTAAALSFVKEDGGEMTIEIMTSDEALDQEGKARVTLTGDETQGRIESPKIGRTRD